MSQRLTGRQLAIMRVLWERGEATVADVQQALAGAGQALANSTVATLLGRLEQRGVVEHREQGRTFVYAPLLSEAGASSSLVGDLLKRLFDGRPSQLVSHLLEREEVDAEELTRIRELLAEHEAARRAKSPRRR
jgi:predicted transcriptional regulator